ncbi:MAG: hypothetical protein QXJ15_04940 [Candidatus Bathyarchaeia archaeon]
MRLGLAGALAIAFGALAAIWQFLYWDRAVRIAGEAIVWNGEPCWGSGGPVSFFPWPRGPGPLMVITPMSDPIDRLIFGLIRSGMYILAALALVLIVEAVGWYLGEAASSIRSGP